MKRTAVGRNPVRIDRPILQNKHDGIKFRSGDRSDKHIALRLPNRRFDPGSSNASPTKRGYLDRANLPPTTELPIRTRKNISMQKTKGDHTRSHPLRPRIVISRFDRSAPRLRTAIAPPRQDSRTEIPKTAARTFSDTCKAYIRKKQDGKCFPSCFLRIVRPGTRPSGQKARIGRATAS